MPLLFYLGTHKPNWLRELDVPLFVSRRRLEGYKTLPRAKGRWALDSGGFSELSMFGKWTVGASEYAGLVRRFASEVGGLEWAAAQDWMCEPVMLAKTGLTIRDHQDLTVANYLDLRSIAPDLPFVPVLQGWLVDDYRRHVDLYLERGVDLSQLPTVGIGSVCRRAHLQEISALVAELHGVGLRLHGFGVKIGGLRTMSETLVSSDSMAWSLAGRKNAPLPDCVGHKNCANCMTYALKWRDKVLALSGVR